MTADRTERKDQHRIEIYAMPWRDGDGATLVISCNRGWYQDLDGIESIGIDELNQRAQEHAEVCR